ncbi:hypothetical protein L1077_27010 [Pseudoalteromonas luteoviolacea]|uniref:hypothetical protein n=1 Tax=Pseudoalteromonas luteoviolacea TaxID=43657 RepID=UPI001F2D91FC|nr:hypothetical protein [Pseudoalteromonas luteoviolacea]MCF6443081.1 hypothetical protein [Pseudoalteromonas luteoviolacea]
MNSDNQLHGAHPRYNQAIGFILDEIHGSKHDNHIKRQMLIEVIERAKIHLEMNEPPLMKKHGTTVDMWIKVLRPAIDRRK